MSVINSGIDVLQGKPEHLKLAEDSGADPLPLVELSVLRPFRKRNSSQIWGMSSSPLDSAFSYSKREGREGWLHDRSSQIICKLSATLEGTGHLCML